MARATLDALPEVSFPTAWSFAAAHWGIAPGLAIACSRHETQYSRLFRS